MCSHDEAPSPGQLALAFGVEPIEQGKLDLWPGYFGPFVRGGGPGRSGGLRFSARGAIGVVWPDTWLEQRYKNCPALLQRQVRNCVC
jgi:hypothetical protein